MAVNWIFLRRLTLFGSGQALALFVLGAVLWLVSKNVSSPVVSALCNIASIIALVACIVKEERFWLENKFLVKSRRRVVLESLLFALLILISGLTGFIDMSAQPQVNGYDILWFSNFVVLLCALFCVLKNHLFFWYERYGKPFFKK
jgi:uncharacterized membrane protein